MEGGNLSAAERLARLSDSLVDALCAPTRRGDESDQRKGLKKYAAKLLAKQQNTRCDSLRQTTELARRRLVANHKSDQALKLTKYLKLTLIF